MVESLKKKTKNWSKHKGGGDTGPVSGWLVVWLWLVGGNTFLCGGRRLFGSIDKCTISKHKISMYIYSIHTRNWTYIPKIAIVFRNYFHPTSNMILLPMTRRVIMMVRFTWVIYIYYTVYSIAQILSPFDFDPWKPTACTWGTLVAFPHITSFTTPKAALNECNEWGQVFILETWAAPEPNWQLFFWGGKLERLGGTI